MSIKARPTQRLQLLALNVIVDQVLNRSEMGFETDIAKAIADLVDKTRFERLPAVKKEIIKVQCFSIFLCSAPPRKKRRSKGEEKRQRIRDVIGYFHRKENPLAHFNKCTATYFRTYFKTSAFQHTGEMKDISTHVGQEAQTRPGIDATEKITTFFLRVSKNGQIQCLFLTVPQISPTLQGMWF